MGFRHNGRYERAAGFGLWALGLGDNCRFESRKPKAECPLLFALLLLIPALLFAGCRPSPEKAAAACSPLLLAQVVDETDFLAQAGQVEAGVLRSMWAEQASLEWIRRPSRALPVEDAINAPERLRGQKVFFRGKLLAVTGAPPAGGAGRSAEPLRCLVLLPDGGVAACLSDPGAGQAPPAVGSAVEVSGIFLKRWIALDGSGTRYVAVPMVAGAPPAVIGGAEAGKLAGLEPARGLLPIAGLAVPPVWSRPVVELDAQGRLRLDGAAISRERLNAGLARLAAGAGRTPLGESALVVVVLVDKDAPAEARAVLEKSLPARAVFRTQSAR